MTELKVLDGKQGNDSTNGGAAGAAHEVGGSCSVTGVGRRMGGSAPEGETDEPGEHPNRVDGSENPESGDALLENHENGVWNQEREAEALKEREIAGEGEPRPS